MASFELCFFFILSSPVLSFAAVESCGGSCGGQDIRFPFKLTNQPDRCGYPGFDLSCKDSQAILTLPSSGKFRVQSIDYRAQTIWLNDPDYCVSKRLLQSFTLSGSPFQAPFPQNFTFLNCSSDGTLAGSGAFGIVNCLSNENYTVVALQTDFYRAYGYRELQSCFEIATVVAPLVLPFWSDPSMGIRLTWKKPNCRSCERHGGNCQFGSNSGLDVRCSGGLSNGVSKGVKYGLIFGLGGPLLFILGITFFLRHKRSNRNQSSSVVNSDTMSSSVALGSASVVKGLDGQTIESYPMTVLGASRRLPKPSDNTCSICLSEYQAKETLRTLPDCQHYFHANCLDGWLRLNGTCPLCRNTPEV